MPTTIPLTPRQRTTLSALMRVADDARNTVNAYCIAVIEGAADGPAEFSTFELSDAGLMVNDPIPAK